MDFINYTPALEDSYISDNESEMEDVAFEYGNIEKLIDLDSVTEVQATNMTMDIDVIAEDFQNISIIDESKKKKKYGPDQIRRFIQIMQDEGTTVPKAAVQCMIPRSTAYVLFKEFNAGDGTVLPGSAPKGKNRGTKKKLFPQHTAFLVLYLDKNPSSTLGLAREELTKNFPDLTISLPSLWKHITEECAFSLKQTSLYNQERDAERTLRLRYEIVSQWKKIGVDFRKNCVFIDESGFNTHMIRGRAWSKVGEPASVTVHKQRGANISIVGCIAYFGTVNFSKVDPLTKSDVQKLEQEYPRPETKKRKANTQEAKPKPLKKGTTAYHIVKFMEVVMDTLDKHDKKGFYIVMDNCRIHHSAFVVEAIIKRGYKPLFMPPYSPFLNPIEECWAKIKSNIKRNPLDKADTLTSRLPGACQAVTVEDCQGWIRHAETFWDRCIDKELGLR